MRLMSFSLTTPQILARTKTVTRRMGWTFLRPGDLVQAIEKGQGLKKGEHVKRLAVLRVVDVRREPLNRLLMGYGYGLAEIAREGFEGQLSIYGFIEMFCRSHKGCMPESIVTRIQFEYVDVEEWWPCACVKGGDWRRGRPSTHIRLNAPDRTICPQCGAQKPGVWP